MFAIIFHVDISVQQSDIDGRELIEESVKKRGSLFMLGSQKNKKFMPIFGILCTCFSLTRIIQISL